MITQLPKGLKPLELSKLTSRDLHKQLPTSSLASASTTLPRGGLTSQSTGTLLKPTTSTSNNTLLMGMIDQSKESKKDYAMMLQQKLEVLIQEREQESQKLMFGIGAYALTKSLAGSGKNSAMSNGHRQSSQEDVRAMLSHRMKKKSTILGKKSKFDKIIEMDIQKKQQTLKGGDQKIKSKPKGIIEEELKLCKSQRKLGVCTEGEKCPYAHSLDDIKYYRPQSKLPFTYEQIVWVNVIKSVTKEKHDSDDSCDSIPQAKTEEPLKFKGEVKQTGRTELMEACRTNNAQGVSTLLQNGALVNQKDFLTRDAIYYCVRYQNYDSLCELIKQSLFLLDNTTSYAGAHQYGNILHIAAQYADAKVIEKLVSMEIYDSNHVDKLERSPIFYSVIRDEKTSVKVLGNESYMNFDDVHGKTLLDYARENHNQEILCYLVEKGSNLGHNFCKGIDLLFYCIYSGFFQLFQTLIKKGVPFSAIDPKTKDTSLVLAYSLGATDIVNFLLASSDSTLYSMGDHKTGQNIMIKAVLSGDAVMVDRLLTKDPFSQSSTMDHQDFDGKTSLMYCCELGRLDFVKKFLVKCPNINLNIMDKHGQTAPMFAAMAEHPSILQLLCTLKFNINWTDNLQNHLFDHCHSQDTREMVLDYIRNKCPDFSEKDRLNMISSLTSKIKQPSRPGTQSTACLGQSRLAALKRVKQARMDQILEGINQEYQEELRQEGLLNPNSDKKLIHEKFIQSRIAMLQLTKQAMHKAKELYTEGKDQQVENYFEKEEAKLKEKLLSLKQVKHRQLEPKKLACQLFASRKRLETAQAASEYTVAEGHMEYQPFSQNLEQERAQTCRESIVERLQTPASQVFSKMRNMKQQSDKGYQNMVKSLSRRQSAFLLPIESKEQTKQKPGSQQRQVQRRGTLTSNNFLQQIRDGTLSKLADHLKFKREYCREKEILEQILDNKKDSFKIKLIDGDIFTEQDENKAFGIFSKDEIDIFKDKYYSSKEIDEYFRSASYFYTQR